MILCFNIDGSVIPDFFGSWRIFSCQQNFTSCARTLLAELTWIRPSLEYGAILYSGAAQSHLSCLDSFQASVENMCRVSFPPLIVCCNASILGLTCRLLADEGRGNLMTFCPKFKSSSSRTSNRLHTYDPASHLRFQNPCNFRTLDRFR